MLGTLPDKKSSYPALCEVCHQATGECTWRSSLGPANPTAHGQNSISDATQSRSFEGWHSWCGADFHDQPVKGPLASGGRLALACVVIASAKPHTDGAIKSGIGPLQRWSPHMQHDLSLAQKHAWNLARTLMTPIVLFKSDDEYGVLPADEVEEAEIVILFEYDPYTGGHPVH